MTPINTLTLQHERVDDIPLILGLAKQMGLPEVLDRRLGNHGLQQGLTNGWLATVWLAFILSEADHRKCAVEEWAQRRTVTLERLIGQPLRPGEFADDRLETVLRRLSNTAAWEAIEADLWEARVGVYDVGLLSMQLDATTVSGYHTPAAGGLMQRGGCSKDHRPDLAQLKLMVAAARPTGLTVASDIVAGQTGEDNLYLPLAARVRKMLGRTGLLYVGDSKMGALATRAELAYHQDYYLTPLPLKGETKRQFPEWIEAALNGEQPATTFWEGDRLLGVGYEVTRELTAEVGGRQVEWDERVLVVRSVSLLEQQAERLRERLAKAEAALAKLTPAPTNGKRQIQDEAELCAAVDKILDEQGVRGLLHVEWQRVPWPTPRERARKNAEGKPVRMRYTITTVKRDPEAVEQQCLRLGWRVQVTNLPVALMDLGQCVRHYRGNWCLERSFHLLKDRPLGIGPLYVQEDDQIIGLTRLLTLGLRFHTLIETQVRKGMSEEGRTLKGLYPGQPSRETDRPTAVSILKAIARSEITLTQIQGLSEAMMPGQIDTPDSTQMAGATMMPDETRWHLTPLPPLLECVLAYLNLPYSLYTDLPRGRT